MKLLFDQNLSPSLPRILSDIYPDSLHVREIGMRNATDTEIWQYAKTSDFVIVLRDVTPHRNNPNPFSEHCKF